MATDPRGRWFRVYARQVRQHPKFRTLSFAELGAWTDLRAAAELLDGEPFVDRNDAILVLLRRDTSRARCMKLLDRLVTVRLLDDLDDGGVGIHDITDHDRPKYPSDDPAKVRERVARHRSKGGSNEHVTSRYAPRHEPVSTPAHARAEESRGEAEPAADPMPASELPSEDDSATLACRTLFDSGKWLGDREYVAAWDDLDRRYTAAWVQAEIPSAFAACMEARGKVLPWDLKRMTEGRLAERSRAEERQHEEAAQRAMRHADDERRAAAASLTAEERERQSLMRRAISVWTKRGMRGKVPEQVDELRQWLDDNEQQGAATA